MSNTLSSPRTIYARNQRKKTLRAFNAQRRILGEARKWELTKDLIPQKVGQVQIIARSAWVPTVAIDPVSAALEMARSKFFKTSHPLLNPSNPSMPSFMTEAITRSKRGEIDSALESVYDEIRSLITAKNYALIEQIMANANPEDDTLDVYIGVLSASRPARRSIPIWHDFREILANHLIRLDEDPERTLPGR